VLENLSTLQSLGASPPLAQEANFMAASAVSETAAPTVQAKSEQAKSEVASSSSTAHRSSDPVLPKVSVAPVSPAYSLPPFPSPTETITPTEIPTLAAKAETTIPNSAPDAWSSIEDLFSQSNAAPATVQRFVEDEPANSGTPPSGLPGYSNLTALTTSLPTSNPLATPENSSTQPTETVGQADEQAAQQSANDLETLAREIYGLLRQRLEIERERSGRQYLGRLPW
jgi:hypothetical protein